MLVDFLIPRRPVSLQTKNRTNLRKWKRYVRAEAQKMWKRGPVPGETFRLMLVYWCADDPVDADNIIKPIQDALVGLVYVDDVHVIDVECHRRPLYGTFDIVEFPALLLEGLLTGNECVYVQVSLAGSLEAYL